MPKVISTPGRHIIVEGPDGAGKSTLIKALSEMLSLPVHPKFAKSSGPDLETLDRRTHADLESLAGYAKSPGVYDRYPLISELIYGPLVRHSLTGWFNDKEWVDIGHKVLQHRTVVVWCLPRLGVLRRNVSSTRDMPGVREHIDAINLCYMEMHEGWKGPKIAYNYEKDRPESLVPFIKSYI